MTGPWADWPPGRPIRVDGGIKARSRRGAIGEQWWSRRFIDVLESYGMSGRLARGRAYARAGQVLDFQLTQGKVTADVQGSRVRPYQVRIAVLPLTTAQWRRVAATLASQALFGQGDLSELDQHTLASAVAELRPHQVPGGDGAAGALPPLPNLMAAAGIAPTVSAARRLIAEGGAYLNNHKVTDVSAVPGPDDLLYGRYLILRRGRRTVGAVDVVPARRTS